MYAYVYIIYIYCLKNFKYKEEKKHPQNYYLKCHYSWDFPGGPVVKALRF